MITNLNIIYNKNYLVIVPKIIEKYAKYFEYSFGNTLVFDSKKDITLIINFINDSNFKQLIFVDYQIEYDEILKSLNKNTNIKFIFTKSLGAFSNEYIYSLFKGVLDLYKKYNAISIGFLDKNLYNTFKSKNINCSLVLLDVPEKENMEEKIDENCIGILNDENNPNHSFYNELTAVKLSGLTVKIMKNNHVTNNFLKTFNIKNIQCKNIDDCIKNNLLNLYINFTDNNEMIFIESMDAGVPCIIGNSQILNEDKFLKEKLIVNSDDNVNEISSKMFDVSKNRTKILNQYNKFRKEYKKNSVESIEQFLGQPVEKNEKTQNYELLLSIIVPVYNTEKYLEGSLNSIIRSIPKSIIKMTEILIINDGSTDNSEDIIIKYKKKYPNLIKYIKQENHGLGNVRNVALKNLRGKYIASIDSDDTVNRKFFFEAINYMKSDIDIIMYDWLSITDTAKYQTPAIEWIFNNNKMISKYEGLLYTTIMPSTCNKIVKSSLYKELNISYYEDKYEDLSTNPFVMLRANSIKYINKPYYEYYIRSNSIMRSSAGYSMIDVIKEVNKRLKKYKKYVKVDLEKFLFYTFSWRVEEFIFNQLYTIELNQLEEFVEYIYTNLYDELIAIFSNKYYNEMIDKLNDSFKNYILNRNKAFENKELVKYIKNSLKKNEYYKLTAPIIYFGENN